MSVLLAFVTAIAAKLIPPDVETTKLQAEIDTLKRELDKARTDWDEMRADRDRWQVLSNNWRSRYEDLTQMPEPALAVFRQARAEEQWRTQQTQMLNQIMAQQAMQNLNQPYQRGLLGAQNLQMEWCNCVPARHDVLGLGSL